MPGLHKKRTAVFERGFYLCWEIVGPYRRGPEFFAYACLFERVCPVNGPWKKMFYTLVAVAYQPYIPGHRIAGDM